jgi:hypothetical protein
VEEPTGAARTEKAAGGYPVRIGNSDSDAVAAEDVKAVR